MYMLMAGLIDTATQNVQLFMLAAIVAAMTVGAIIFLVARRNKIANAKSNKNDIPRHDYSKFNRANSMDYVKIDDIYETANGFGMLVTDNYTRFIAGISLTGFDYDMASDDEKYATAMGMIGVTSAIDSHLQIRQDARPVEFDEAIKKCSDIINSTADKCSRELAKGREVYEKADRMSKSQNIDQDLMASYVAQLKECDQEIQAQKWIAKEQNAIINEYTKHMDRRAEKNPERTTMYIVDWQYNKMEHMTKDISTDDIYAEALDKLWVKTGQYMNALAKCGVFTKRLTGKEILDAERYHMHPLSFAQYKTDDALHSSYRNLFTTSDYINEMLELKIQADKKKEKIIEDVEEYFNEIGDDISAEEIESMTEYIPEDYIPEEVMQKLKKVQVEHDELVTDIREGATNRE